MTLHIKHAGVWKEPEVHVKHAGVWKRAEVFVKKAGAWVQVAFTIAHSLSPTSKTESTTSNPRTLAGSVISTVTGGTVTSRTWGFTGQAGGTWTIATGAGTGSVTIRCAASAESLPSTASLYCDAVVGGVTYRKSIPVSYTWQSFA
jgi:hypothetical protein